MQDALTVETPGQMRCRFARRLLTAFLFSLSHLHLLLRPCCEEKMKRLTSTAETGTVKDDNTSEGNEMDGRNTKA